MRLLPKLAEPVLRVNRNIVQNETKQRKISHCWPLKVYYKKNNNKKPLNTEVYSRTFKKP